MKLLRTLQIGRSKNCDIQLAHDTVSRNHARLELLPGAKLRLTDLGSSNGTWFELGTEWQALESQNVTADQLLRFGEHEVKLSQLLEGFPAFAVLLEADVGSKEALKLSTGPDVPRHENPRRNPGTGEIEDAT